MKWSHHKCTWTCVLESKRPKLQATGTILSPTDLTMPPKRVSPTKGRAMFRPLSHRTKQKDLYKLSDRREWNSAMLSNRERIAPQQTHNIPQLQNLGKRANPIQSLSRKEPRLGGNVNKGRRTQKSRLENIWGLWRVATLSKICSKIFRAQESALKLSKGTDTTPYDTTKVKEVKQIQRPNLRLETSLAVFSETGQRLRHIQEKLQKIWMRFAGTNTQTSC